MMSYEQRQQHLAQALRNNAGRDIRLSKQTSNLFRNRSTQDQLLDVREFNHVLAIDPDTRVIETEGMVTYEALADTALAYGLMPAVVPQLKSITIGGAVGGIGIESSSFRYGLPHETVLEMDVLLGTGEVICCTPNNEHRDLFFGLANSYGTLGYILRLKIQGIPVKPYVRVTHVHCADSQEFFDRVNEACQGSFDFVDGVVFAPGEYYLVLGEFTDDAPYTSDYSYLQIFYRSIRARSEDYLSVRDYLWRWDTDWFWCSKNLFLQYRPMRRLLGRERLNSITYQKVKRWNSRWGLTRALGRLARHHREWVIQDVDIPIDRAAEFLEFFHREIGIRPVWICPVGHPSADEVYPLFPITSRSTYINFGFWDAVATAKNMPSGHFNRLVENKVSQLGGIKSLYSDAYFGEDEFWSIYDGDSYQRLKQKYDPGNRLKGLYQKCVLRQ